MKIGIIDDDVSFSTQLKNKIKIVRNMKELFFHILRYLRPIIKEISPYT